MFVNSLCVLFVKFSFPRPSKCEHAQGLTSLSSACSEPSKVIADKGAAMCSVWTKVIEGDNMSP